MEVDPPLPLPPAQAAVQAEVVADPIPGTAAHTVAVYKRIHSQKLSIDEQRQAYAKAHLEGAEIDVPRIHWRLDIKRMLRGDGLFVGEDMKDRGLSKEIIHKNARRARLLRSMRQKRPIHNYYAASVHRGVSAEIPVPHHAHIDH
ncbi:MAG: hypothetical protein JWM81_263 [Candidatus Saccharibacteria bacterium]|nr:hypothetical protein [Candidatus Saccharibacteria bacterium]